MINDNIPPIFILISLIYYLVHCCFVELEKDAPLRSHYLNLTEQMNLKQQLWKSAKSILQISLCFK